MWKVVSRLCTTTTTTTTWAVSIYQELKLYQVFFSFKEMCGKLLFLIKVEEDISTRTTYHSGIKLTFK